MNKTTKREFIELCFSVSFFRSHDHSPLSPLFVWKDHFILLTPPSRSTIPFHNQDDTPRTVLSVRTTTPVDLVLFTTEDVFNNTNPKLALFRDSSALYHARFSYHCILFTNNQDIIRFFEHSVCKVITDFKRNPYGLPYIYSMYSIASTLYKAKYYGYLNSDILIEPVVFPVLNSLDKQVQNGSISRYHELAGRVHPIITTALPTGFSTLEEVEKCFVEAKEKGYELRDQWTAVFTPTHPHS